MIKIGDKVRCVKDVMLDGDVLVKEGAIGIVRDEIVKDKMFGVEWISGEYRFDVTGVAKWGVELDEIELIEDFKGKSIEIDEDGVLFWNDGNGDEIIGNVRYIDRDVLIDVIKTIVDERDDLEMKNEDLKDEINDLNIEIAMNEMEW